MTVVERRAGKDTGGQELAKLLDSFLAEVARQQPALALLWIPREVDTRRVLDIATIFPPEVTVVRVQFRLLGGPWEEEGEPRLQGLLLGRLGLGLGLSLVLAREQEDGQWRQVILTSGGGERDVEAGEEMDRELAGDTSLVVVLEVTQEMKTRPSAFSRAKATSVYGTNYVTSSLVPAQYSSSTTALQPLTPHRVRRELVNGFLLRGQEGLARQLVVHLDNWRTQVEELEVGEGVFSLVVVPRKVVGEMRRVVEEEVVGRLPVGRRAVVAGWGERLSTAWRGEEGEEVLRKIDKKQEVLVIQIDLGLLET